MRKSRKFKSNSVISKLKKDYFSNENNIEIEKPLVKELNRTQRFK